MPSTPSRRDFLRLLCGAAAAGAVTGLAGCAGRGAAAGELQPDDSPVPVRGPLRVGSWGAAPVPPTRAGMSATGFTDRTVRMVVRPSVGGTRPRITVSNVFGTRPLRVAAAAVAVRLRGPEAIPGTGAPVRFRGRTATVVPVGGERSSDEIPLPRPVRPGEDLLVSLYLAGPTGPVTWHPESQDATWLSERGDHTRDPRPRVFPARTGGWYCLTGVDVYSPAATGTVVAFGDSLTDGVTQHGVVPRWTDTLAQRIAAQRPGSPLGVVNVGIRGNRLLTDTDDGEGTAGVSRFHRDVLGRPAVTDVFLLEGINDIGHRYGRDGSPITARMLIEGYLRLIAAARARGIAVHGGTLLPFAGASYYTDAGEQVRQQVNHWIRTSGAYDSVVDFERVVRDPFAPERIAPAYDRGDHLHPDDRGFAAMGEAVDLRTLRG